ncbi:MAG TPA: flavin reductase family protein [Actinomycetota bacterium]|nr:flavin reductase family protein [Actinomycetota bacterium]
MKAVQEKTSADDLPRLVNDEGVDPDTFRSIMGALPTGVAVVTGYDRDGIPRGLTCSAVCSVSMTPPLLLVCVDKRNRTLEALRDSGGFVVNFLRAESAHVSQTFASRSPDKFSSVAWRRSPTTGLPWLYDDSLAFADCRLAREIEAGDHTILLGSIVDGGGPVEGCGPLMYWQRCYGAWPVGDSDESALVTVAATGS